MTVTKIYGPPGTGKTTRLLQIVKRHILAGVPRNEIAYISHTRAANEVILERMSIEGLVGNNPRRDLPWFRTIHASCSGLLGMGRMIIDERTDYKRFTEEYHMNVTPKSVLDAMDGLSDVEEVDFSVALAVRSLAANTCRDLDTVCAEHPLHVCLQRNARDQFLKNWDQFKRRLGKFDFTDMLTMYVDANGPPLPCKVVIIDEAQDLSDLQWKIIDIFTRSAEHIYIAGDDDQAVYGFIGGSEFGFYHYPANEEIVLEKSYRVPRAIGERATQIIKKLPERKDKSVQWVDAPGDIEINNNDEVMGMPWRDWMRGEKSIMVLTRHRRGSNKFSRLLREIGIPHGVNGVSLAASREGQMYMAAMTLKQGGVVRPKEIALFYYAMGKREEAVKWKQLGIKNRKITVSLKDSGLDLSGSGLQWARQFMRGNDRRWGEIHTLVYQFGLEGLRVEKLINISTMHGAKGKEAHVIIVLPDCTEAVKRNMFMPSEVRLSYVTLTRAKERVILLPGETEMRIDHFENLRRVI